MRLLSPVKNTALCITIVFKKHEKTALKRACILHCVCANKKYSQRGLKFFFIFSQLGFLLCPTLTGIKIQQQK